MVKVKFSDVRVCELEELVVVDSYFWCFYEVFCDVVYEVVDGVFMSWFVYLWWVIYVVVVCKLMWSSRRRRSRSSDR